MSSLDKFPDWSLFENRDELQNLELLSPASEIAADLQKFYNKLVFAQENIETVRRKGMEIIIQQAVFINTFAEALQLYAIELQEISQPKADIYKHFRVLKDQMIDALTDAGYEIVSPIGKSFDDVADFVHIQHWRHHESFTAEVVSEVIEPIVKYNGEIVRLGRVIMGAPSQKESNESSSTKEISND